MYSSRAQGQARPKISTMPRQKTEAAAYLDIYKLVIEKKRLQQEIRTMEQRQHQAHRRLGVLEQQITTLENNIQTLRDSATDEAVAPSLPVPSTPTSLNTLTLEY